jgi:hypothetical protein
LRVDKKNFKVFPPEGADVAGVVTGKSDKERLASIAGAA